MASPAADGSHPRLFLHANSGYSHGLTIAQMATRLTGNNSTHYQALIDRADTQYGELDADVGAYECMIMALIGLLGHGSDNAAGMTFAQTNAEYSAKAASVMVAQDAALVGNQWYNNSYASIAWACAYDYLVAGSHLTGAQQDVHIAQVAALSLPAQDLTDDQPAGTALGWLVHHLSIYNDRTGVGEGNEGNVTGALYETNYAQWGTDDDTALIRMHAYLAGPGYANKDYWHHATRDGCITIYYGEAHRGAYTEDSLATFWNTFTYSVTWWDGEAYTYRRGDCVTQWPYWLAHACVPWGTWDDGYVTSTDLHLMPGADPRLGVDTNSHSFLHMLRASRMANAWDTDTAELAQWWIDTLPDSAITEHREGIWANALLAPGGITGKRPDHAAIDLPLQKHAKTGDWIMWRSGWASDAQIGGTAGGPAQVDHSMIGICAPKHRTRQPNAQNAGGLYYAYHGWLQGLTRTRGHGPREEAFLNSGCYTFHDPTWIASDYSDGANILNGGQFTNPATPDIDFINWQPDGYQAGTDDEFWQCRVSRLSHDQDTSAGYNYALLDLTRAYDSTRYVVNASTSTEWIQNLTRTIVHIPASTLGTDPEVVVHVDRLHKGAAGYEPRLHFSFPVAPTLGGTETDNAPTKNVLGFQPAGHEGAYYKRHTGSGIENITVANSVQGASAELHKTIVYPTSTASYELERLGEPTAADEWGETGRFLTVTSIANVATTATVTVSEGNHQLDPGDIVSIRRADGSYWSDDHTVVTTPTTQTFTVTTSGSPADPGVASGFTDIICYRRRGSEFDDQHGTPYDTTRTLEEASPQDTARDQLVCPHRVHVVLTDSQTEHQVCIVDEFGPAAISKTTVQALGESGGVFLGVQFGTSHVVAVAKSPTIQGVSVDYEEARVESGAFTVPDAGTYTVIVTDLPSSREVTVSGGTSSVVADTDAAGVWTGSVTTGGANTTLTVTAATTARTLSADGATYAWGVQDVTLTHTTAAFTLAADPASYTWSVQDVTLATSASVPTVDATAQSTDANNTTSRVHTLPAGLTSGDGLLVFVASDGSASLSITTSSSGWTRLDNALDPLDRVCGAIFYKQWDSGTTITIDTSAIEKVSILSLRISGHLTFASQAPDISTVATDNSVTPDPTSATVSGGPKNVLALAFASYDQRSTGVNWTGPYATDLAQNPSGSSGALAMLSYTGLVGQSSVDPAAFDSDTTTDEWVAWTVLVQADIAGAFSLTADAASYAWTGQTVGLQLDRSLSAESASYTWTPQNVVLSDGVEAYRQARMGAAEMGTLVSGLVPYGLRITIGGTERGVIWHSLRATMTAGRTPNKATFRVHGFTPTVGQQFLLYDDGQTRPVWGGVIVRRSAVNQAGTPAIWDCEAVDWTFLLDKHALVLAEFDDVGANTAIHRIVSDFVDPNAGLFVGSVPASFGNISANFDGVTVSRAINAIAEQVGAYWTIEPNGAIWLFTDRPESNTLAMQDDTVAEQIQYDEDVSQTRNRVIVSGSGSQCRGEANPASVEIPVDDTSGYDESGGVVLVRGQLITYTGVDQTTGQGNLTGVSGISGTIKVGDVVHYAAQVDDTSQQSAMATTLGGGMSGVLVHHVTDRTITSAAEAADRAAAELEFFDTPQASVTFRMRDRRRYVPGVVVTASLTTPFAVSGAFRVQDVTLSIQGDQTSAAGSTDYALVRDIEARPILRRTVTNLLQE